MKITITKIPTGIHSQLTVDVERLHIADDIDLITLAKINKIVKEYNDEQDRNA